MAPRLGDGSALLLPTPLIIQADMPGVGVNAILSFGVKPSRKEQVAEGLLRLLRSLADEYEEDLQNFDFEASQAVLEHLKRKAMDELETWRGQLRLVEEWKSKVDGRDNQMNKMREDYFKELQHLREQVYQKTKAEKENKVFQPSYALHFDPSEYLVDDEVAMRVREKAVLMEQEFSNRIGEVEHRYRARVDSLTQQLMASRLKVTRMEMLMEKVLKDNGFEDVEEAQKELGEVDVQEETVMQSIESETTKAEDAAVKKLTQEALAEKDTSDDSIVAEAVDGKSSKSHGRRRSSALISIEESGELKFDADLQLGDDEDDDGLSDGSGDSRSSLDSSVSHGSGMSKNSNTSSSKMAKLLGVASAVKKASRRFRGKGKTDKSKEQSSNADFAECVRVDVGVDALPYTASFGPKVSMHTRAVQSQIDGRMLDKALDFFDKTAEHNWNLLAGITCDSDSDTEAGSVGLNNFEQECSNTFPLPCLMYAASLRDRMGTANRFELGDTSRAKLDRPVTLDLQQALSDLKREQAEKTGMTELERLRPRRTHTIDVFGAIDWRHHFIGGGKHVIQADMQDRLSLKTFGSELEATSQVKLSKTSQFKGHLPALRRVQPAAKEDFGVQVAMISVAMISPFEHWFPADVDPHEIQFQQVMDMTNEILDRLPYLRQRAEKLAAEAKGDSNREEEVLSALRNLNLIAPATPKPVVPMYAIAASDAPTPRRLSAGLTLDGVLARHGIVMDSQKPGHGLDGGKSPELADDGDRLLSDKRRHTFGGRNNRGMGNRKLTIVKPASFIPSRSPHSSGNTDSSPKTPSTPNEPEARGKSQKAMRFADNILETAKIRRLPKAMANEDSTQVSRLADAPLSPHLDPGWSGCGPQQEFMQLGVPAQRDYLDDKKPDPQKDNRATPPRRVSASSITFDGENAKAEPNRGARLDSFVSNDRQSFPDDRQSFNRTSFSSQVSHRPSFKRAHPGSRKNTRSLALESPRQTYDSFRSGRGSYDDGRGTVFSGTDETNFGSEDGVDCLDMDDLMGEIPGDACYTRPNRKDMLHSSGGHIGTAGSSIGSDLSDVGTMSVGSVGLMSGSVASVGIMPGSAPSMNTSRRESDVSLELPGIAGATPRFAQMADDDPSLPQTRFGKFAGTASNLIHKAPSRLRALAATKKKEDAKRPEAR